MKRCRELDRDPAPCTEAADETVPVIEVCLRMMNPFKGFGKRHTKVLVLIVDECIWRPAGEINGGVRTDLVCPELLVVKCGDRCRTWLRGQDEK